MKQSRYGLLGVAAFAALFAACKGDPLADSGGSLQGVDLQFSYLEVVIGDSVRTFAIERDALNTPLPPTATVRSCNTGIATVVPVSDAPQQRTGFFVKGITFGTTCVIVEAGTVADTMDVATFPASIVITGPDTVRSGEASLFTFEFRDRQGNPVTGVPDPTFTTSDTNVAVTGTPLGTVSGRSPGIATITVSGVGTLTTGVSAGKGIVVAPGAFTSTLSATSGDPGDTVKVTRAPTGPVFDADTRVLVNGVRTFTFNLTADTLRFIVPAAGVAGSVPLALTNMGPQQVAQTGTFTSNTASFADPYDGVNDNPSTAPVISANGDYFIIMQGACDEGVATQPGDDCDDFFTITNSGGVPDTLTVRLDWFDTADPDILWCNSACNAFVGNFAGATANNPESSTVFVPAGTTWRLWINLFGPGSASTIVRVRVTNKN